MDTLPFAATSLASTYERVDRLPAVVLLDNVRSLYNVGAFFRTADAVRLTRICLAGIAGSPPNPMIAKTALGAEETVPWERADDTLQRMDSLRSEGYELAAVETSVRAIDLFDWTPRFPVCVIFGHEVDGLSNSVLEQSDARVRIPMLGRKQSLNVATAGGVVLYELLRKYRNLMASSRTGSVPTFPVVDASNR